MQKGGESRDTPSNKYERKRDAIIRENKRKMQSLNLESMLNSLRAEEGTSSQKAKETNNVC